MILIYFIMWWFLKVFAFHSTSHVTIVIIIIKKITIIVFPLLRMTESLIQRQLNQYSATEHRICSAKYMPLAILNKKKKIPVTFKPNWQSLQSRILFTAFINVFLRFLKDFFPVAVSASIQRHLLWWAGAWKWVSKYPSFKTTIPPEFCSGLVLPAVFVHSFLNANFSLQVFERTDFEPGRNATRERGRAGSLVTRTIPDVSCESSFDPG